MKPIAKWSSVVAGGVVGAALILYVGTYLAESGQYLVPATTIDDPALPSRNIGGYRYHLEIFGIPTRPVVIALHGGPGADYRYLLPLKPLSEDYQVVFYDQRGSGLSPRVSDDQLSFDQFVDDLNGIVKTLSPHGPVRLIGHGFGAMLAAAYLDRHPDSVSHAVLAEPDFLTAERGNQWLAATHGGKPPLSFDLAFGTWRSFMQSMYVYGPDDNARGDFYFRAVSTLDVPDHPYARSYCGADRRSAYEPVWRTGARAAKAVTRSLRGEDDDAAIDVVTPAAKRFPHKVLLLAGSCNTITGPAAQRENVELFGNAELQIIDDAGHTMFGERPDSSLSVIRRYLAEDHSAVVASD
jgi:proline iminopeptidase